MHCECCDKLLTDAEACSKFSTPAGEPVRYTQMCTECQSFLPKSVKVWRKAEPPERESADDFYDYETNDPFSDLNE